MSGTLLQLASVQSNLDAGAHILARYEALPIAHHRMEEAMNSSKTLAMEEVVAWAASLHPGPQVIHIDLRTPRATLLLGTRLGERTCGGNSACRLRPFVFCTFSQPLPSRTNCSMQCVPTQWGIPRTPTFRSTPALTWRIRPPRIATLCAFTICVSVHHLRISFPPLLSPCQSPLVGGFGHRPFRSHHPTKGSHPRRYSPHFLHHDCSAMVPGMWDPALPPSLF